MKFHTCLSSSSSPSLAIITLHTTAQQEGPKKFYAVWEEEESLEELASMIKEATISPLDKTLYALLKPKRLLELLHSLHHF